MKKYRTRYHLLLDRSNPKNPRWVVAKEYAARPAKLPADYTVPAGRTWLREVGVGEFDWLRRVFGRDTHVTTTEPGRESYSTPLRHVSIWTEYTIPAYPDDTRDPGMDERDDPDNWADDVDEDDDIDG